MSVDVAAPRTLVLEDLTLEEAIDALSNVRGYIASLAPELARAQKDEIDLTTQIALLMEQKGQRKFERGGWRGGYKNVKRGSASVSEPAALRAELLQIEDVPRKDIEEALPIVEVAPVVKPDLRKVRKLAEYGNAVAHVVTAHVVEALEYEVLVIEPIVGEINVTPTPEVAA